MFAEQHPDPFISFQLPSFGSFQLPLAPFFQLIRTPSSSLLSATFSASFRSLFNAFNSWMKKFPANLGRENQPDREPQPPSQTGKTITFPGFFSPVFREMNSDWSLSETVLNNFAKKFPMKILTAEVSIKALQKKQENLLEWKVFK